MPNQNKCFEFMNHIAVIKIPKAAAGPHGWVALSNIIADFCERLTAAKDIRVVVIGAGDKNAFDLHNKSHHLKKMGDSPFALLAEPIAKLEQLVIGAIDGHASGLGLELLLACDIRMAPKSSLFSMPQITEGSIPYDGGTQRLPRLIGIGKALEMILTGSAIDATEARRIGLINKIVPSGRVFEEAMKLATEMAAKGPISISYAKEAILKGMDMTLEQGLRLEADLYMLIHTTADRVEGIKAFTQKRTATFKGE